MGENLRGREESDPFPPPPPFGNNNFVEISGFSIFVEELN